MCISHKTDFKKNYACKIPFVPMVHGHKFKFFSDPLYIYFTH